MTAVTKLISISSEALGVMPHSVPSSWQAYDLGAELFRMLQQKNGFYAFEQALHIFPLGSDVTGTMTLEEWNSETLWRNAYGDLAKGFLFFAEDIFGDQFCIASARSGIFRFDAERGEAIAIADFIETWAELVLSDYKVETGWPLSNQWQAKYGPLPLGKRLQPRIPFVYGGEYTLENLWAGDATEGMMFKAEVALKVKDLPDGTKVVFRVKQGN